MPNLILKQKLPPNMRSNFWNDFIDSIEEESLEARSLIGDKKFVYNIDNMSYERLLELASILQIPFDVSVIGTEEFLREEVRAVPFRIKWKATVILYLSFFRAIDRFGSIYLYYWDTVNLIRHTKNLLLNINNVNPYESYQQESQNNFTGNLSEQLKLDSGLKLDENWQIDNATSKQGTKHFALEYFIDRFYYSGSDSGLAPSEDLAPSILLAPQGRDPYLMTPEYFEYIKTNMEVGRKATEVPHIGAQLTAITDDSRFFNSLGFDYTMPELRLNAVSTDNISSISSVDDISYMIFGTDVNENLPSQFGGGIQPTALTNKIAKIEILNVEKYNDDNWYGVSAKYQGNFVNDFVLATGDGIQTSFSNTLPIFPVKRNNLKITFISDATEYEAYDNGYGQIVGEEAEGTINYTTGEITLNTNIYYNQSLVIGTGTGVELNFNYTVGASNRPLTENSLVFKYVISGTTFVAYDDGLGNITGTDVTGTVNYVSGEISLTFSNAPANNTNIILDFQFEKITIPDDTTDIMVEYYHSDTTLAIKEAGITNSVGDLLAYATFPNIEFNDFSSHLSMNFIIKKSNF